MRKILSVLLLQALIPFALIAQDDATLTKVGDQSPVTAVKTIDGKDIALTNQVVVLNFFATWCGPCLAEMPHLEKELWQPLKDKGLVLVAVGREHSEAEVKAFKEKKQFTFFFAADPKREVFSRFARQNIPRCVLVGKDGMIKYQSVGYTENDLKQLIESVKKELAK